MKALLLAAGRGERMRPLSDTAPKPLLMAGGKRLIEWQIEALVRAGVREIVINTAHLATLIEATLGDGQRYAAQLTYSHEGDSAEQALETLGGIVKALPSLATHDEPFIVASSDIVTDFDYATLASAAAAIDARRVDAHLVLVDNPAFHPAGDMGLANGLITLTPPLQTYANIGLFSPRLFRDQAVQRAPLFPWLYSFARAGRVSGEHYAGRWANVGTPGDVQALDRELAPRLLNSSAHQQGSA